MKVCMKERQQQRGTRKCMNWVDAAAAAAAAANRAAEAEAVELRSILPLWALL